MKTKHLLPIALILVVGFVVLVSAADPGVPSLPDDIQQEVNDVGISIHLNEGWNLIGMYTLDDSLNELVENEIVEYVYIFDNVNKDYVRLTPKRESGKLGSILGSGTKPGYFLNAGVWVYLREDYDFFPTSIDDPASIDVLELTRGWNLFSVTPDMVGKSLNDIKGDCNIEKAYLWDSENQQWGTIFNFMNDRDVLDNEAGVGNGLVLKVSGNCKLSGASTVPPALPVECNDNDGGLNYAKRGTAFSTKHVNSLGEITTSESSFGEGDSCCTECDNSEDGDVGEYLLEGYCDELGVVRFKKYNCPNGCENGVCVGENEDEETDDGSSYIIKEITSYTFDRMGSNGISNTEFGVSFKHYEGIYDPYAEGNVYVFNNNADALTYYTNAKQSMDDNGQDYEVEIVDGMELLLYYPESNKQMHIWTFGDKVIITQEPNQGDNVAEAYFAKYS